MCCESCWQARAQSAGMIERIRIQPLDVRIVAVVEVSGAERFWRLLSKPYGYSKRALMSARSSGSKASSSMPFFPDQLPAIYSALRITADGRELIAEVQQHLGDDRVRAVAMDSTDGLARGSRSRHRRPITVPVGDPTLGRLWNVIGEPIDKGGTRRPTSSAGRSTAIRRASARLSRRSRSSRRGSR